MQKAEFQGIYGVLKIPLGYYFNVYSFIHNPLSFFISRYYRVHEE